MSELKVAVPPPSFDCSLASSGLDAAWIRVSGELDISTTPRLARTLRASPREARLVVLDLRELSFTDSSGLHVIAAAGRDARQAGRRLVVLRAPPDVHRMFTLTGISEDLEIIDADSVAPTSQVLVQLAGGDGAP